MDIPNIAIRFKRPYLCHQIVWRELLHSFLEITVVGKLTISLCCSRFGLWCLTPLSTIFGGRRGRDRMVVGFTVTFVISVYHQKSCEVEPC
jgi:hypothetical protein